MAPTAANADSIGGTPSLFCATKSADPAVLLVAASILVASMMDIYIIMESQENEPSLSWKAAVYKIMAPIPRPIFDQDRNSVYPISLLVGQQKQAIRRFKDPLDFKVLIKEQITGSFPINSDFVIRVTLKKSFLTFKSIKDFPTFT